jgi:hypothetical protein
MQIEQVQAGQRDELVAFLRKIFQAPEDSPFVGPRLIDWKYFEERPGWSGPRSYVLRARNRIAAHGGIVSTTLLLPQGPVTSVQIIDWAADRAFPGAGLVLLKQLAELADVNIGLGGSLQGVSILGSHQSGIEVFAHNLRMCRVIRPWRRPSEERSYAFKPAARLVRDSMRLIGAPRGGSSPWSATPVDAFEHPLPPPAATNSHFTPVIRSAPQLNYLLRCPAVRMTGYLLKRNAEPGGHLLLSQAGAEVRIADLQVATSCEEDWRSCFRLAVELAGALRPKAWCVRAIALPELIQRAAQDAGLRECSPNDAFLQDPHAVLAGRPVPNLSMIDSDAAYL